MSGSMLALRPGTNGSPPKAVQLPKPEAPANWVLIQVKAALISPSDVLNAEGHFHHEPETLGRDYAGTIIKGATELVGKDVYGTSGSALSFAYDGTHAEYCVVPQDCVAEKPTNLSFAQAASVGLRFTTAALALNRAGATAGDKVLILGATGGVGTALCELATFQGCEVLKAARHGDVEINLSNDPNLKGVNKLTNGKGPDVIIDTTGSRETIRAALDCLAIGGRLAFIAAPREGSTELAFDMLQLYRDQQSIIGCNTILTEQTETASELAKMKHGFELGSLTADDEDELEHVSISQAVEAYSSMMSGGVRKKYVIIP